MDCTTATTEMFCLARNRYYFVGYPENCLFSLVSLKRNIDPLTAISSQLNSDSGGAKALNKTSKIMIVGDEEEALHIWVGKCLTFYSRLWRHEF